MLEEVALPYGQWVLVLYCIGKAEQYILLA